jgi:hypothetical protein
VIVESPKVETVSMEELCEALKISARQLRAWRKRGCPVAERVGVGLRFNVDEVSRWRVADKQAAPRPRGEERGAALPALRHAAHGLHGPARSRRGRGAAVTGLTREKKKVIAAADRRRARAAKAAGVTPEPKARCGGILTTTLAIDWQTPPELLLPVRRVLGGTIPLDVATAPNNPTGAARFFTGAPGADGLIEPWDEPWFCNPPYGRALKTWLALMVTAHSRRGVALLPCSRWEQGYMHDLLRAADTWCLIRKRVAFIRAETGDRVGGNPYASFFLGFGIDPGEWGEAFGPVGLCLATREV